MKLLLDDLLVAIQQNNINNINKIISTSLNNNSLNKQDKDNGDTPLIFAFKNLTKYSQVIKVLLENTNIDVTIKNNYNCTALRVIMNLARKNTRRDEHKEIIKLLVEKSKSILETVNTQNHTYLEVALINTDQYFFQLLLDAGAKIDYYINDQYNFLEYAIRNKLTEISIILIKSNKIKINHNYNNTYYIFDALEYDLKIFEFLLENKENKENKEYQVDFNVKKKISYNMFNSVTNTYIQKDNYISILHSVADMQNSSMKLEIFNLLIAFNIKLDLESLNDQHETPLLYLIKRNVNFLNQTYIKILINAGANINAQDNCSFSILYYCIYANNLELLEFIFKTNKKITYDNNIYKQICLSYYNNNNNNYNARSTETLDIFIHYSNNVFKFNKLILAVLTNNLQELNNNLYLLNDQDKYGNSALAHALLCSNTEIIKLLLEVKNINLYSINCNNESILQIAKQNNYHRFIMGNTEVMRINLDLITSKLTQDAIDYNNIKISNKVLKYLHKDVVNNIIFKYL
jgi:ankyrin repeat protein